ncbi:MAG: hypothetical protein KDA61_06765, partial [Planctomycetales bacterium]|nr:hypothetical protein [Planctomycetales bacterium]
PQTTPDELEALIWALLDGQLEEAEQARLEKLLEADERAREHYVECIQLHCDLTDFYRTEPAFQLPSPILTNLPADFMLGEGQLPQT